MTLHPHVLHARAALWSLSAALTRLHAAAHAAARAAAEQGDAGTLQAWRPGAGIHAVGRGDQLLDAVIRHVGGTTNPYADRAHRTADTIRWIGQAALGQAYRPDLDMLGQLLEHLPAMRPATAAHLARWLDEEDRAVRRLLGDPDDRQLLPVIACPSCHSVGVLALRTSAPAAAQVIVCTAGCWCAGQGCGCRMGVEAEGAEHVWTIIEMRASSAEEAACSPTTTAPAGPPQPRSQPTSATA